MKGRNNVDPKRYLFVDERLTGLCVFCGGTPDTDDHIPPKVLLERPFPQEMLIVDACAKCNQASSLDEEYLACLLEVVLSGSTDPATIVRPNISRAMSRNPRLRARLEACREVNENGEVVWRPEFERVRNVVIKLSRGHIAYELSVLALEEPTSVNLCPLISISDEERGQFERAGSGEPRLWPEVGSRAMLRAVGAEPYENTNGPWIEVQGERYRYSVDGNGGVCVRIVFAEYLACETVWEAV